MEIRNLSKLATTFVQIFLVYLAKDLASSAQTDLPSFRGHGIDLPNSVPIAIEIPKDKIMEVADEILRLQNADEYVRNPDVAKDLSPLDVENKNSWNSISDSESKRWHRLTTWGKRSYEARDMSSKDSPFRGSRKWPNFSSWGKRKDESTFSLDTDKQMNEASAPSKRQRDTGEKWRAIAVWGKREPGNSRKAWKSLAAWGKRDSDIASDKKWKGMSVWGKREGRDLGEIRTDLPDWNKHKNESLSKKWKEMATWGKRNGKPFNVKKWDELGLWGKRTFRHIRNWRDMDMWMKRPSWTKTGFASWGKRSADLTYNVLEDYHPFTGKVFKQECVNPNNIFF